MSALRLTPAPIVLRRLVVTATESITPHMRRVVLGGPQLGAFEHDGVAHPAFASPAFDDHVKLIFAPGGDIADAVPLQHANGIEWRPSTVRQTRDYTPVEVDVAAGVVAFDFVVHSDTAGPAHHAGPAEHWATGAQPGDELWVVGPKSSTVVPQDVDWVLLAGDETALPAVRRFFAERPVDGPVRAVLCVTDVAARQALGAAPGDEVVWVTAEAGHPTALADAVESIDVPEGRPYVWAAAESRSLLPIRKYVKRRFGADKSNTDITGYWHVREEQSESVADAETAARPGGLLVTTSPVTWFAIRAALQTGLVDVIDELTPDRRDVAERLGVSGERLGPLIDVLIACRVLTADGDRLALGEFGDRLIVDGHLRESFDGGDADMLLSMSDYAQSLSSPQSAWEIRHGATYAATVSADREQYAELMEQAEQLVFLLPAITSLAPLADGDVSFCGPGATLVADGLARSGAHASAELAVVGRGESLVALREAAHGDGLAFRDTWCPCATAVAAQALAHCTDDEALEILAPIAEAADTLVVIEPTSQDALSPRVVEKSLVQTATYGTPVRDSARWRALLGRAGWTVRAVTDLGWGVSAFECERAV